MIKSEYIHIYKSETEIVWHFKNPRTQFMGNQSGNTRQIWWVCYKENTSINSPIMAWDYYAIVFILLYVCFHLRTQTYIEGYRSYLMDWRIPAIISLSSCKIYWSQFGRWLTQDQLLYKQQCYYCILSKSLRFPGKFPRLELLDNFTDFQENFQDMLKI